MLSAEAEPSIDRLRIIRRLLPITIEISPILYNNCSYRYSAFLAKTWVINLSIVFLIDLIVMTDIVADTSEAIPETTFEIVR